MRKKNVYFCYIDKRLKHKHLLVFILKLMVSKYIAHIDAVAYYLRIDRDASNMSVWQRADDGQIVHVGVLIESLNKVYYIVILNISFLLLK